MRLHYVYPYTQEITEAFVRKMIVDVLDQYEPIEGRIGRDHRDAALVPEKAWFVLLLPFIWLKSLFKRKDGE